MTEQLNNNNKLMQTGSETIRQANTLISPQGNKQSYYWEEKKEMKRVLGMHGECPVTQHFLDSICPRMQHMNDGYINILSTKREQKSANLVSTLGSSDVLIIGTKTTLK